MHTVLCTGLRLNRYQSHPQSDPPRVQSSVMPRACERGVHLLRGCGRASGKISPAALGTEGTLQVAPPPGLRMRGLRGRTSSTLALKREFF